MRDIAARRVSAPTTDGRTDGFDVTSSTRKMFQGIIPRLFAHGEPRNVRAGNRLSVRRYPPTLTYHASTDDVDESGLHVPRGVRREVAT